MLGVAIYFQIIVVLSASGIQFVETLHRLPILTVFDSNLLGSIQSDEVALVLLCVLAVMLNAKRYEIAIACAGIAASILFVLQMAGLETVAEIVAISILPSAIVSLYLIKSRKSELSRSAYFTKNLIIYGIVGFFAAVAAVECISLVYRTFEIFSSNPGQLTPEFAHFDKLEDQTSYALGIVSPAVMILVSFSFLYRNQVSILVDRLRRHLSQYQDNDNPKVGHAIAEDLTNSLHRAQSHHIGSDQDGSIRLTVNRTRIIIKIKRQGHLILLGVAAAVSSLMVLFAHLPVVNQQASGISTDEQFYIDALSQMQSQSKSGIIGIFETALKTSGSDRPLTLLVMYMVGSINNSYSSVPRYFPLALAPALVIAVYSLIRYIPSSESNVEIGRRAALLALFAALSPQIVVGLYGGFNANWFALIPGILAILVLIRILESNTQIRAGILKPVAILFGLLVITLFFHVYLWGHLVVVLSIFLGATTIFYRNSTNAFALKIAVIAMAIAASVGVDVIKSFSLGVPTGLSRDEFIAGYSFSLDNFGDRWQTLYTTFQTYLGGFLVIPAMAVLTLFWAIRSNPQKTLDRFFLVMLSTLSIPLLFGGITIQARLLYDIPLFIPAILAISGSKGSWALPSRVLVICLLLISANYAIRSISNIGLVLPEGIVLDHPFLAP